MNEWLGKGVRKHSFGTTYKLVDRGLIELFGPYGLSQSAQFVGKHGVGARTDGQSRTYIGSMVLGRFRLAG